MALSANRLRQIADIDLARLLMQRLWTTYDMGGISHRVGRSIILEFSLDLIPPKKYFIDGIDTEVLIKEAMSRPVARLADGSELFMGFENVSDECFISLAIAEIAKWYAQDSLVELPGKEYVSHAERSIFTAFARLFPVEDWVVWFREHAPDPTEFELVEDGRRRCRLMATAREKMIVL